MNRLDDLERRIDAIERHLGFGGAFGQPLMPVVISDGPSYMKACSCPPNTACDNAACPHLVRITGLAGTQ